MFRSAKLGALLLVFLAHGHAAAQTMVDPLLRASVVGQGLGATQGSLTVDLAFLTPTTVLVANRQFGQVRRMDLPAPGSGLPAATPGPVVLDLDVIAPTDDSQSEYGLQGIALHPDFANNHWVYVRYDKSPTPGVDTPQDDIATMPNFTASLPSQSVIERYVWDAGANGGSGGLTFDRLIFTSPVDTRYHHGSSICFGTEDPPKLYAVLGDQRHEVWIPGHAGRLMSTNVPVPPGIVWTAAVIVRLNDDGTIPADNPFPAGAPGVPAGTESWYGYGVRNSFGLASDPATGRFWYTDNGEGHWDEIDCTIPGYNGGSLNIAGPAVHPRQTGSTANLVMIPGASYVDPAFSWWATLGVTGICFLTGSDLGTRFDDTVLTGGFNAGFLWRLKLNPARTGFVFTHPGLQDRVDDRNVSFTSPVGTEAQELLFGTGFGVNFGGILAIEQSPAGIPHVLTATGQLIAIRACPGDFDRSGELDSNDVSLYLNQWFTDLVNGTFVTDVVPDGEINSNDVAAFLNAWFMGC